MPKADACQRLIKGLGSQDIRISSLKSGFSGQERRFPGKRLLLPCWDMLRHDSQSGFALHEHSG